MIRRCLLPLLLVLGFVATVSAQSNPPLRLEKAVLMSDVQGRIDHMFFDPGSGRLFVAALGNNTVEIIDIKQGRRVHTISGLHEPQGILYLSAPNRIYVANGDDGTVRIFDGSSYQLVKTTKLGDDADNIRWDDEAKRVYVGYGKGALAAVDENGTKIGQIPLDGHPESFHLEQPGNRIFVNVPESREIAVVDKRRNSVIRTWTTDGALENFPMAIDQANHKIFVVCRLPARLLELNMDSGEVLGSWPIVGDCDDVFYDATMKRIYATGGEGKISVFQQQGGEYREIASIPTRKGARTSFFSPEAHMLFVAERRQGSEPAAIYVYDVEH